MFGTLPAVGIVLDWCITLPLTICGIVFWFRRGALFANIGTVVLQEWDEHPSLPGELIRLRGRRAGLIAMVLEMLRVDPGFALIVRRHEVEIAASSLSGRIYHRVPIGRMASTRTGYARPLHWLFLGLSALVQGLLNGLGLVDAPRFAVMTSLLIAAAMLGAYAFGQTVFFGIETCGGSLLQMRFRGSVGHGRVVVADAARRLARLLGDLTLAGVPVSGSQEDQHPGGDTPTSPGSVSAYCGSCGTRGTIGTRCASCSAMVE